MYQVVDILLMSISEQIMMRYGMKQTNIELLLIESSQTELEKTVLLTILQYLIYLLTLDTTALDIYGQSEIIYAIQTEYSEIYDLNIR